MVQRRIYNQSLDHEMESLPETPYVRNSSELSINDSYTHTINSGYASLSADERLLLTSNLKNAIDVYSIPPSQHIQSLPHPVHRNVPLMVCSVLDGALTLAGSDDGSPRIFDQRIGTVIQSLPHGNGAGFVFMYTLFSIRRSWHLGTSSCSKLLLALSYSTLAQKLSGSFGSRALPARHRVF
jgi:WD40 repeat protein